VSRKTGTGELRIIGGTWRHRKVSFPDVQGLRPTPDRVRETLFNWLQPVITGARCLDLFAGSGVLGLEALSRGAAAVVMVEHDGRVTEHLSAQAVQLGGMDVSARVVHGDALDYLRGPAQSFDIVFVDPPFNSTLLAATCRWLDEGHWLAPGAHIYLEAPWSAAAPPVPRRWQILRHKRAGQVGYYLARAPVQ
jgi:16S rRNA (guanine966-N2)-methyltransferase